MINNNSFLSYNIYRDEEILWFGKPNKLALFIDKSAIVCFATAMIILYMPNAIRSKTNLDELFYSEEFVFYVIFIFMPILAYIYAIIQNYIDGMTEYAITNKATYMASGFRNKKFVRISHEEISEIHINKSYWDNFFNIGDISITSKKTNFNLNIDNVKDADSAYFLLKDIYQRINYPEFFNYDENGSTVYENPYSSDRTIDI